MAQRITINFGTQLAPNTQLIVIPKLRSEEITTFEKKLRLLEALKNRGYKLVLDYTDNYLRGEITNQSKFPSKIKEATEKDLALRKRQYEALVHVVDAFTVSSKALKDSLGTVTKKPKYVIPDAIDDYVSVSNNPEILHQPAALWFGMAMSFQDLLLHLPILDELLSETIIIYCLTHPSLVSSQKNIRIPPLKHIKLKMEIWSVENMQVFAAKSDFVYLPISRENNKFYASENRLITAFSLEKIACATIIPSYTPYRSYFFDLESDSFTDYLKTKKFDQKMIQIGKEKSFEFTKEKVAEIWQQTFLNI